MDEHTREATTPASYSATAEGDILIADCSCGGTYTVPQGGDELAALDAGQAEHAAPFARWQELREEIKRAREEYEDLAGSYAEIPDAPGAENRSERYYGRVLMCDRLLAYMDRETGE